MNFAKNSDQNSESSGFSIIYYFAKTIRRAIDIKNYVEDQIQKIQVFNF